MYFIAIPHTLQTYFALLYNLVWTCAYLGSAVLHFMFGLADTFPHFAPTHSDEILLQQTLPSLIYYLPMSNAAKIIRVVSVLVHEGLADSTLRFLKPFGNSLERQESSSRSILAKHLKFWDVPFPWWWGKRKEKCLHQMTFQKPAGQLSFVFWWCIVVRHSWWLCIFSIKFLCRMGVL